jgi:peroxiredoxin Q/BCP
MITEQQIALPFSLPDQTGSVHKLSDYHGSWLVIYFYPKDDTPGCTTEACGIRDTWTELSKIAKIIGVSTDSPKSHAKFAEKYQLPFPLLADTEKEMVNAYGVYAPKKFMGREFLGTHRVTVIVDPLGSVAKVYPKVAPAGHANELLTDLKRLQQSQ